MSTYVMSDKYPCFVAEIEKMGHRIIATDRIDVLLKPEQMHADMQVLQIFDKVFILSECIELSKRLNNHNLISCSKKLGKNYPENILLNFLFINNKLYGKLSAIDERLLDFCEKNKIKTVNINQGYARCSTLVLNDKAVVTSDLSIEKALKNNGVEVLLISPGNIKLDGFNYGFIGGASGKIDDETIVFFGDLKNHPDYKRIEEFCKQHNLNIKIICENIPLTDIGGVVRIK